MAVTSSQQTLIANIYVALFNRAPDASGFEFWTQALGNGASPAAITAGFVTSPEARAIYPTSQTADEFVSAFYQTVFGRAVDQGGLAFWTNALNAAGGPGSDAARSELVTRIVTLVSAPLPTKPADLTDAQYAQTVADRDLFNKKVVVAVDFGLHANSNDLDLARQVLAAVGAPPSPPAPTPDPFAFTTGTDALLGTADDDVFTADNTNSAARTLTAGDSVDGRLGTDTLRYRAAATDTTLVLGTLTRIEKLHVIGGGALDADVRVGADLTDVEFEAFGGALRVDTDAAQTLTITGNNGAAVQEVRSVYGVTDEAARLVLKGSGKAGAGNASKTTIDGVALHTLTLSATGAADSFIDLYDGNSSLRTLTITGDRNLSVDATNGHIETIDASAATGNMTLTFVRPTAVTIKAGNGVDAITTGSGDDTIVFAAGKLTVADSVDGGAGRDTLLINDTTPVYAAINAAAVEVLSLGTTGATVDIGLIASIQQFAVANTGTTTFTNAKSTSAFTIDNRAGVAAVEIVNAAGQTATDITLVNNGVVPGAQTVGTVTIGGATSMSLTSTGASTNANVITTLAHADAATITVKGSAALTFGLAGTAAGSTVNASAFTGKLAVTGSGFDDTITGGADADVINGGAGADRLTGGGGFDVFVFASRADTKGAPFSGQDSDARNIDRIVDWAGAGVAAGDSIRFGGGAGKFGTGITFSSATTVNMWGTGTNANTFDELINAMNVGNSLPGSTSAMAQVLHVIVNSGTLQGKYLMLNDDVAGWSLQDTIISVNGANIDSSDLLFGN